MNNNIGKKFTPRLIAFEMTRTCNLHCKHCRADAAPKKFANELSKEEIFKILENISSFASPIIILTGGEPMTRKDIYDIASYGKKLGLTMVMAPCGFLITKEAVEKIKKAGIGRISLSLDAADSRAHNEFRGQEGSFEMVMNAANIARENGLEFQINSTIHKDNAKDISKILELAIRLGAKAFHPFLLVPTGRAKNMSGQALSPAEYEKVLMQIYELSKMNRSILIKPTCAPHYARIKIQEEQAKKDIGNSINSAGKMGMSCMGGQAFAFISHTGIVQACGFLDVEAGDLRKEDYDFKRVWEKSPLFLDVRDPKRYKGKCGACDFLKVCGGCRARAYALTGDYMQAEPCCAYENSH